MSVPAADGLILKGVLTYPPEATGRDYPLAVLAHQYPASRDSYASLVADLLAAGIATLAFDQRGHGDSITSPRGPLVVDTPEGVTMEGPDGPTRIRAAIEGATAIRFIIASSEGDPAMAIYFAVRDELVGVLREGLGV